MPLLHLEHFPIHLLRYQQQLLQFYVLHILSLVVDGKPWTIKQSVPHFVLHFLYLHSCAWQLTLSQNLLFFLLFIHYHLLPLFIRLVFIRHAD